MHPAGSITYLFVVLRTPYYLNNSSPRKKYFSEQFIHNQIPSLTDLESVAVRWVRSHRGLDKDDSSRSGSKRHLLVDLLESGGGGKQGPLGGFVS